MAFQADLQLTDDRALLDSATEAVLDAAKQMGYPEAAQFALRLAIEEAVRNAIKHGHRDCPEKPVDFRWSVDRDRIFLEVEDKGPGFTPVEVPDPTLEENLSKPSGRGLMLMRAYMTEVKYNETGNRVTLVYRNPHAPE